MSLEGTLANLERIERLKAKPYRNGAWDEDAAKEAWNAIANRPSAFKEDLFKELFKGYDFGIAKTDATKVAEKLSQLNPDELKAILHHPETLSFTKIASERFTGASRKSFGDLLTKTLRGQGKDEPRQLLRHGLLNAIYRLSPTVLGFTRPAAAAPAVPPAPAAPAGPPLDLAAERLPFIGFSLRELHRRSTKKTEDIKPKNPEQEIQWSSIHNRLSEAHGARGMHLRSVGPIRQDLADYLRNYYGRDLPADIDDVMNALRLRFPDRTDEAALGAIRFKVTSGLPIYQDEVAFLDKLITEPDRIRRLQAITPSRTTPPEEAPPVEPLEPQAPETPEGEPAPVLSAPPRRRLRPAGNTLPGSLTRADIESVEALGPRQREVPDAQGEPARRTAAPSGTPVGSGFTEINLLTPYLEEQRKNNPGLFRRIVNWMKGKGNKPREVNAIEKRARSDRPVASRSITRQSISHLSEYSEPLEAAVLPAQPPAGAAEPDVYRRLRSILAEHARGPLTPIQTSLLEESLRQIRPTHDLPPNFDTIKATLQKDPDALSAEELRTLVWFKQEHHVGLLDHEKERMKLEAAQSTEIGMPLLSPSLVHGPLANIAKLLQEAHQHGLDSDQRKAFQKNLIEHLQLEPFTGRLPPVGGILKHPFNRRESQEKASVIELKRRLEIPLHTEEQQFQEREGRARRASFSAEAPEMMIPGDIDAAKRLFNTLSMIRKRRKK